MSNHNRHFGFSLIELLLAIFILGIGIIAVAAIFPAGIAQQQRIRDDVMGPIVAAHAIGTLQSKLSSDDFGTFEQFDLEASDIRDQDLVGYDSGTISGDWGWMRPSFLLNNDFSIGVPPEPNYSPAPLEGAIDIFGLRYTRSNSNNPFNEGQGFTPHPATENDSDLLYTSDFARFPDNLSGRFELTENSSSFDGNSFQEARHLYGIPFNRAKYAIIEPIAPSGGDYRIDPAREGRLEPLFTFTQAERTWPQGAAVPEYYWDCMFRRYQGRVQVAVFVYRVGFNGGEPRVYTVSGHNGGSTTNPVSAPPQVSPAESPFPVRFDLGDDRNSRWYPRGPLDDNEPDRNPLNDLVVPFTNPGVNGSSSSLGLSPLSEFDVYASGWQRSGQWLLDQNGTVHRVLAGRTAANGGPVRLTQRPPYVPRQDVNGNLLYPEDGAGSNSQDVDFANMASAVKTLWFIPPETRDGFILTPVYVAVGEI